MIEKHYNISDYTDVESPCYVVSEKHLRANLSLIRSVAESAGVEIIMAFTAFALWKVFPIVREYISCSTASSLSEANLAVDEMKNLAHTYAPVYTDKEFDEIAKLSSHITFNSISQFEKYKTRLEVDGRKISAGLRINPEYSAVETDLYNPCAPGSRLGVTLDNLKKADLTGIDGFHCHTLCESTSYELEKTLKIIEERFGEFLPKIKWLNMGGGHLMTRADYDTDHLISVLKAFKSRHPHLHIILEPGSAFAWQTGELVAEVQDIVENGGIRTAILDVSFACHMPDCLEMPYKPAILGEVEDRSTPYVYRMGGNSCLSGDFYSDWTFDHELKVGEKIVFMDMNHYTTVKTTMFNGITHPSIALRKLNGELELLRKYTYADYKSRMA